MDVPGPTAPRRRRDRHGRGLRGSLAPFGVPLNRSRADSFDSLVLDAVEDLEREWELDLSALELAVEDVPPAIATPAPEVVLDRGVVLGQLLREGLDGARLDGAGFDGAGGAGAERTGQPAIVLYRRPIETRAKAGADRSDLVFAVVTELAAEYFGKDLGG